MSQTYVSVSSGMYDGGNNIFDNPFVFPLFTCFITHNPQLLYDNVIDFPAQLQFIFVL